MAPHADLHVHTTCSDGALDLAGIPAAADRAGVAVVAVTDHDRVHPGLDRPVVERAGTTVVRGVELRVDAGDQRLDLLGYGVDPTSTLAAELERLQRDRIERARAIVDCLEARLGVDLDVPLEPGVGRPHLARAVAEHPALDYDVAGVFGDLIGEGRPCYVARDVTGFEEGADLLAESCGLVSLAHPLRYPDPAAALARTSHPAVGGVERYYPYGDDADTEPDPAPVDAAVREHGLLPTGGSDAHGTDLGAAGLSRAAYERVAEELS